MTKIIFFLFWDLSLSIEIYLGKRTRAIWGFCIRINQCFLGTQLKATEVSGVLFALLRGVSRELA